MLRVEVFPLLEITPKELLLTPNMRYTLQIVGGPVRQKDNGHSVQIHVSIAESEIATVNENWEIKGLTVGDAYLSYEIVQH